MTTISTPKGSLVCGVDCSPHAATVVALAADLAERLKLRLRLVHSPDPDVFLVGQHRRDVLARGAALLESFGVHADEHVVALGDPEQLLGAVIDEDAVLAVVGSRGRGPARAALLGSVSSTLAARSRCPLIVVPPHAEVHLKAAPTIICGLDGSTAAETALRSAAGLALRLNSPLLALHARATGLIVRPPSVAGHQQPFVEPLDAARAAVSVVEQPLAALHPGIRTTMRIAAGNPVDCLTRAAAEAEHAIIVVGSHGYGPLRAALLGSVSVRLAAGAPVPVMIVPASAETFAGVMHDVAFASPIGETARGRVTAG
jgi:nucleotide-binding universal stress UspA family protein